jgi:perosamine synthetase
MPAPIPLSNPDITQADIDAVVDVLHTPTLSIGPKVEEFERACARVAGRRHGVAVNSGTSGLHLAMLAANVQPGDEVITTPFSFVASANCILYAGGTPVFVDIDPKTLNLNPDKVEAAITPRTKAIVAVEAFGHPGGMLEVEQVAQRHELVLIEDACEGFGGSVANPAKAGDFRPIGSFGRASVFAFYPNKQITTGEGGMIVTDDDAFAAMCRSLRNQGRDGMSWLAHARLGYNYRLSEINAALGVAQVGRLDDILDRRRQVAHWYIERLMTNPHLILPTLTDELHMSWFVFVIRLTDLFAPADRDLILQALRAEGIGCNNYFPPIHLQPYMAERFGFKEGQYPVTEYVSARTLAIPFFTNMTQAQVGRVCDVLEPLLERTLLSHKPRF